MKKFALLLGFLISFNTLAKDSFLLIQKDVASIVEKNLGIKFSKKDADKESFLLKVSQDKVEKISGAIHHSFHKCGGFFNFETEEEAKKYLARTKARKKASSARNLIFLKNLDLEKKRKSIVKAVDDVQEISIREMIEELSSFKTRFYESESGIKAAKFIAGRWKKIAKGRSDITVKLFDHSWKQPSVILKIEGKSKDAIVLGGHLDSVVTKINLLGKPIPIPEARSPGADDNASGIATLTEILRVLVKNSFKPERTIFFIGYAAEEVGLLGSKEIAELFTRKGFEYNIQAKVQFDMTNFKGSDKAIYFMADRKFTNKKLTSYLGSLIDRYILVDWGIGKCGYACSDHASWSDVGVPSAFPTEALSKGIMPWHKREFNKLIHTPDDTLDISKGVAEHSVNFAKLGVAYAMDLSKK